MDEQVNPLTIGLVATTVMLAALEKKGLPPDCRIISTEDPAELLHQLPCDAYIDLLFEPSVERLQLLTSLSPLPVFINCVLTTTGELQHKFMSDKDWNIIRINGWPGFLERNIIEISNPSPEAIAILDKLNWRYEITPDIPGFISARVISMIINEAFFALEEKVSTRDEIDTAMKLGTNYPYGPFEWASIIGLNNIYQLLTILAHQHSRYQPAALLKKEASA
jgi:3-hydroxybutyryl-CoA dehydrogenase